MKLKYFLLLTSLIIFYLMLSKNVNVQISDQFKEKMEKEAKIFPQRLNNIQNKQTLENLNLGVNFTTYIGDAKIFNIALGSDNSIYITGWTTATDFPTTDNAFNRTLSGGDFKEIFVMKLSADGSEILFSTYIGGSSESLWTRAHVGMVLDSSDNVIITAVTTASYFPTTPGAYDQSINGDRDVIVAMLSADGSELLFSTFLGGSGYDISENVAIDDVGNIYLSGNTGSTDFPTTSGAYNRTHSGGEDFFVAKLSADGSTLLFSTFLGGSGNDYLPWITLDSQNNVIISGSTSSVDYPTTMDALNTSSNGGTGWQPWPGTWTGADAVLSKLSANGSDLLYSTYLGGTGLEIILDVITDSADNIILTGTTGSSNFPTTTDCFDPTFNGEAGTYDDCFVTKIAADGSSILFSTYLGGTGFEEGRDLAVDSDDNIYITGETGSSDFPLEPEYTLDGNFQDYEAFLSILSADGSMLYSTYFGGPGVERAFSIALDEMNNIYVTGSTWGQLPENSNTSVKNFGYRLPAFVIKFSNSTIDYTPIIDTTTDSIDTNETTIDTLPTTTTSDSTNFEGIPILLSIFVVLITVRRVRKKEE